MMDRFIQRLLRQQVSFLRASTTADVQGSPVSSWQSYLANVPASIQPDAGELTTQAGRPMAAQRFRIYLLYQPGIVAGDRIAWAGRTLSVLAVRNVASRDTLLVLDAQEVA